MFQSLFSAVMKARDDLRNRAGAAAYVADLAAIALALAPLFKFFPQGGGDSPPPAAVGTAPPLLSHSQLLSVASRPVGTDELADGFDGFLQHCEQAGLKGLPDGNVGAKFGDGHLIRAALEKLGPLLLSLFIKGMTGL